ncbi:ferrochelatase [Niveibacterium umoris]|uniref:Ferrochelatase n=1 Tax=Niveibacterium umoris TaxID=1193620 RepID=A0A840BID1_9RHOO|nr:ferrochelatase [Niveibacterium umoris]MBB4012084.1 ferrochelatase [Niveibacterium umoris]
MSRFRPEPAFRHGVAPRIGVLLVNLGTPDAPTPSALRRYLKQFLSDDRVVEIPKPLWWLILNGIILNTRPKKSAHKYESVWDREGSPLAVHTKRQAKLVRGYLGQAGHPGVEVLHAMRYGNPSVGTQLDALRAAGCDRILIVPLYPQYAGSTTGSVADALADWMRRCRNLPELRMLRAFAGDAGYIDAIAASVREHWQRNGRADRLVISFHGVPRYTLDRGDPYHCECHKTARLIAERLALTPEQYFVTFQSRFGRAEWLQPYTEPTLQALAREGVKKVDVICPGFVADCLETLEEIAIECHQAFIAAGGKDFSYIPCLNERDDWIRALVNLVERQASDWLASPAPDAATLERSAKRANALGAKT